MTFGPYRRCHFVLHRAIPVDVKAEVYDPAAPPRLLAEVVVDERCEREAGHTGLHWFGSA